MGDDRADETCLFCRIAAGTVPATIVYSDEQTVAFRDLKPQAPTHILVIPRIHVPNAAAGSPRAGPAPQIWEAVMGSATRVAADEGLGERGYRLVINSGPDAGQSVDHLHVHVLGGRSLTWPPG